MYNLLPGQGLGGSPSSLIAYGLGSFPPSAPLVEEPIAEYRGGGQRGDAWDLDQFETDLLDRKILEEDEELLEIIIMALTSGVLD